MQTFSIATGDYAGFSFSVNPNNTAIVEISHVAAWNPTNNIGALRTAVPSYDPSSPTLEGRYTDTSRVTTSQSLRAGLTSDQTPNSPGYVENQNALGNQQNDARNYAGGRVQPNDASNRNYSEGRDNLSNQQVNERRDEAGDYHIIMEFNRNGGLIDTLRIPVGNMLELRRDPHTGRPRRATEAELNAEEELRLDQEHALEDQKRVADERAQKLKQSRKPNATTQIDQPSERGLRPLDARTDNHVPQRP